jgi:hypothetical protein
VTSTSLFRVEETPGHGSDVVEEIECGFGLGSIDGTGFDQKAQVGIDLFSGAVGDAPVVDSIATGPAMAF